MAETAARKWSATPDGGLEVCRLEIAGLLLLRSRVFRDHRGSFHESWNAERFAAAGLPVSWKQDNVAVSRRNVLRGLHFQDPQPQAKLIAVLAGSVFDVAVDVRPDSPTLGRWFGVELSAADALQLFIPAGFAHGYVALSEEVVLTYKCSELYCSAHDQAIRWNDPELGIAWPVARPILSDKDRTAPTFAEWWSTRRPAT